MNALGHYMFRNLLVMTLAVTIGLTFIVWISQSIRFIELIVDRGLPISTLLYLMTLLLPTFVGLVLPIACFCAILFVYNKMTSDSEMVVMRAAGFSPWQLARPALKLIFLITVTTYAISLYFQPASYRAFKDLHVQLRSDYSQVLIEEGVFNELSEGITVFVRERGPDGSLQGIMVHDSRDPEKPVTMMAESGAVVPHEAGPRVIMANGNRQEVDRQTGRLQLLYFQQYTVEIARFQDRIGGTRWRKPAERYVTEMLPSDLPAHERHEKWMIRLQAEFHKRFVMPFMSITFGFIGLAAILSGEFNRRGQTGRLLTAIIIVALVQSGAFGFFNMAADDPMLNIGLYASALLPLIGALLILYFDPFRPRSNLRGRSPSREGMPA